MSDSKYIHLVTASAGSDHVTSADDGSLYAAIIGRGQYVLHGFEHEVIDNNNVRIKEGDLSMNGRHVKIDHGDSITMVIENGVVGRNRIDLIVITYTNNISGESATIDVIKGTSVSGNPVVPSYASGDILNGDTLVQMPLFRVELEGISIKSVTPLFEVTNGLQALLNMIIPPVGWIEYNETGINPSSRYPGTTWVLVGSGAVAACVDSSDATMRNAGSIVGSNKGRLEANNIPSHKHLIGEHSHHIKKTVVAQNGQHVHRGYVTESNDVASGSAKKRVVWNGAGVRSTNPITFPYMPSKDEAYNTYVGEHFHNIDLDIESNKTTAPATDKTGNISDVPHTSSGDAAEFSTMQKTYLVYRWKRIN